MTTDETSKIGSIETALENACNLSRNEAKVYLALVKLGAAKAGVLSKQVALNRTSTYNALKVLIEKGMTSYVTVGKIKWFKPSDPRTLKAYLSEKLEEVTELLPVLEREFESNKLSSNTSIYRGLSGIKSLINLILEEKKENCVFGSENQLDKFMPAFSAKFKKQLENKGIPTRNIVREGRAARETKLRQVRFIPLKTESPVVTNVFGDKIGIIIWSDPPEAILIDNPTAANAYREYFDFMWRNAKPNK